MSFLIETTVRRMATMPMPVTRVAAISASRTFTTSLAAHKSATETVKDGLKSVDRVVSDKIVDGINVGGQSPPPLPSVIRHHQLTPLLENVAHKAKEVGEEVIGKSSGKASELKGQASGQASELKGQAKGAAHEAAGKAKGTADQIKKNL